MKVTSVGAAMLLLIVGNLIAVLSDSLIKSVGNEVPIFQFVFFRQISAVLFLLPVYLLTKMRLFLKGLSGMLFALTYGYLVQYSWFWRSHLYRSQLRTRSFTPRH